MTAVEFDTYTRGKVIHFEKQGRPFGTEEYLDNRRVRWANALGECEAGSWHPEGQLICFDYGNPSDPQCWIVLLSDTGLVALNQNSFNLSPIYEVEQSAGPLLCRGPDVGV